MRCALTLALAASLAGTAIQAQTLAVRPSALTDLGAGSRARHGEVVLGQTTMAGALRMFAEQLASDSVVVPRAHLGNPSSIPADVVWQMASREVRPRHKLDLGPDHYTLYFDKNSRLIVASTQRMAGNLTRPQLSAHYSALRKGRRWYGGDRPRHDEWSVALSDCVTLIADVLIAGERVQQLSYLYTCPSRASTPSSPSP